MGAVKGTKPWNAGSGKGCVNARGYREIRVNGRVVKEHRHIVEQHLGRKLGRDEDVHHLNGVKADNRIENLQVVDHHEHTKITNAGRTYRRGFRMNLTDVQRAARSERMKRMRAKATQAQP